jgi:hypothetical protein
MSPGLFSLHGFDTRRALPRESRRVLGAVGHLARTTPLWHGAGAHLAGTARACSALLDCVSGYRWFWPRVPLGALFDFPATKLAILWRPGRHHNKLLPIARSNPRQAMPNVRCHSDFHGECACRRCLCRRHLKGEHDCLLGRRDKAGGCGCYCGAESSARMDCSSHRPPAHARGNRVPNTTSRGRPSAKVPRRVRREVADIEHRPEQLGLRLDRWRAVCGRALFCYRSPWTTTTS